MQSIRISSPVFLGVGVKNDVQAFYICDAEVVKVASSLSPVVSLHPLDLLPSAATFFVFVGVH
jgi:CRISPR/Cas system CSM-associated protein Csm5 (group 7 of RAMP superfamily)